MTVYIFFYNFRPHGKESTKARIRQKMEKERENSYKKWRDLRRKGRHKHTETYLIYIDYHRCLSQSLQSEDSRNISNKLPFVYACLSSGDLFIFGKRFASLFSFFTMSLFEDTLLRDQLFQVWMFHNSACVC